MMLGGLKELIYSHVATALQETIGTGEEQRGLREMFLYFLHLEPMQV